MHKYYWFAYWAQTKVVEYGLDIKHKQHLKQDTLTLNILQLFFTTLMYKTLHTVLHL